MPEIYRFDLDIQVGTSARPYTWKLEVVLTEHTEQVMRFTVTHGTSTIRLEKRLMVSKHQHVKQPWKHIGGRADWTTEEKRKNYARLLQEIDRHFEEMNNPRMSSREWYRITKP